MASSQYKKAHMYFLQTIMNRGIIRENECIDICKAYCEKENFEFNGDMDTFLDIVNQQIHKFHFEIRKAKREDNGETVFVFVSLAENDLNRLTVGGDFTRQELDLFKRILELIVYCDQGENVGEASTIDILNLADSFLPKISKTEVKKHLDRFVSDQWFYLNNGMVILSPRTILELEVYIHEVFKDFIHICKMCNMMVFYGKSCPTCEMRLHHFCASRYFSNTETDKCLNCGNPWNVSVSSQTN